MDSNFNREDNIFKYDFIRSSANDFWKLDNTEMRDSDRRFQEMYHDNNQFFSMNLALDDTFSNNFSNANGGQSKNEFEFQEREEEPNHEADTNTTLNRITALFFENQFALAIQYIDKHYPLLLVNHPIIKITILKLKIFRHIINHDNEEGFKTLDQLISVLTSVNMYTQKRVEYLQILIQFPEVIKSRHFIIMKQQEYLNRLLKLISYGLLENGCIFVGSSDASAHDYDNIEEDYLYLKDFEEELVCLLAKYYKLRDAVEDFDDFIYNIKEFTYNPRNKNAIYNEIDEFMRDINKGVFIIKVASPMKQCQEPLESVDAQSNIHLSIFQISKVQPKIKKEAKLKSSTQIVSITPDLLSYSNNLDSSNNLDLPGKMCSDNTMTFKDKNKNVKLNRLKPYVFKKFKRENIDKKTLRKYRRYLLIRIKQLDPKSLTKIMTDFLNNSLFPPFTIDDISFKSFNTSYLIWIFSHADLAEFYEEYIEMNLERMVNFLAETFKVKDECEIETLTNYLKNMAKIYSEFHQNSHCDLNNEGTEAYYEKRHDENEKSLEQQFMRLSVENNFGHEDNGLTKSNNLRMSTKQKEELISRMFDEYMVDLD